METRTQTTEISFFKLFDILLDPESAAQRLNHKAAWLYPLLIVGLGGIALGLANLPLLTRLIEASLPTGLTNEQIEHTLRNARTYQRIGIFFTPVMLLFKWAILAWILFMSCVLADIKVSFKHLFALLAQCSLLLFLQDLTIYIIIRLKGDQAQSIADMTPRLGLDLILTGLSKPMAALVGYFSVFNIWYIVALTLALSFLGGCSKMKAFIAIIPTWLLPLCLVVGLAWLS
jgi:Yip1 domain